MQNELLMELQARGFINQTSNLEGLNEALNAGKITAYLGSDPTADEFMVQKGKKTFLKVIRK